MTTAVLPARDVSPMESRTVGAGLGRIAAGLALASAVVHVLGVTTSSPGSLAMAGMALACLPCAWHLWWKPTVTVWAFTAALDVSMLALHSPPLARAVRGHLPGHAMAHAHPDQLLLLALVLVFGSLLLSTIAIHVAAIHAAARARDGRTGTTR